MYQTKHREKEGTNDGNGNKDVVEPTKMGKPVNDYSQWANLLKYIY